MSDYWMSTKSINWEIDMKEAEARKIWEAIEDGMDFCTYPSHKLRQLDRWIKEYAITQLRVRLHEEGIRNETLEYIMRMANSHFGSMETDIFLMHHKCYPKWMEKKDA